MICNIICGISALLNFLWKQKVIWSSLPQPTFIKLSWKQMEETGAARLLVMQNVFPIPGTVVYHTLGIQAPHSQTFYILIIQIL